MTDKTKNYSAKINPKIDDNQKDDLFKIKVVPETGEQAPELSEEELDDISGGLGSNASCRRSCRKACRRACRR